MNIHLPAILMFTRGNVASWLVCGPPPSLNYFWTLFKVESQKFSSQKKNISSIK